MRKVICFIDGFNLYHAIDNLNQDHLKWLDLRKLALRFVKTKTHMLTDVYFFSAYATWKPGSYQRHRQYVAALRSVDVKPVMGQFKVKDRKCPDCKYQWKGHEEKETDVNIAVAMLTSAYEDLFDDAILISRDSDLAPPINTIRKKFPGKGITVVAPPHLGHCNELVKAANAKSKITKKMLQECHLPEDIYDVGGNLVTKRPIEYTPTAQSF